MADATIKIKIAANVKPFKAFMKKVTLQIYKNTFGWRRFFITEYWRVLLNLPPSKEKTAYSSARIAMMEQLKPFCKFNGINRILESLDALNPVKRKN